LSKVAIALEYDVHNLQSHCSHITGHYRTSICTFSKLNSKVACNMSHPTDGHPDMALFKGKMYITAFNTDSPPGCCLLLADATCIQPD
jgi:hypothetical protein